MDVAGEIVLMVLHRKYLACVRIYIYADVLTQFFSTEKGREGKIVARRKIKPSNLIAGVGGFEPGGQRIEREPFRSRLDVRPWIQPAIDLILKHDEAAGDPQQSKKYRRSHPRPQVQVE